MNESVSSFEDFVRGRGRYVDDLKMKDMLHMHVVRSPYARARIISVKGGLNHTELSGTLEAVGEGATGGKSATAQPVFASSYAMYVGQPVAAVFGKDQYTAEDAAEEVEVEYEPLKAVVTIEQALNSEPIHPGLKSNIISERYRGKPFSMEAPVVLEDTFMNNRVATNPIEPRGIVCNYDGDRLNVWISTQSVHSIKEGLCDALRLIPESVRVFQADTGGAFGLKGGLYPEYVMASYASMKFRKPVKWIESRREHLMASGPGRGVRGRMKLYAERSGRVLGIEGEVTVDGGAFSGGMAEFAPGFIAYQITGPYRIEKAHVKAVSVFTNKVPLGPYRGAGRPEAAFMMERMMDLLADELKMDEADVRLKNGTAEPFRSPLGVEVEASKPFMEEALRRMKYRERANQKAGLAFFVLVPASQPGESCRIVIKEGKVRVWVGGNSHGQAHDVFIRRMVSEELQIPEEVIEVERGDTDMLEQGVGSWGSRSAMVQGAAIISVTRKIRDQVEKEVGRYSPETLLSESFDVYNFEKADKSVNSLGANLALAEIDEFGSIRAKLVASCYDVGHALNPDMVRGQITGGVMQGIGQAISEEIAFDGEGQLLTATISDAGLTTAEMMPEFEICLIEQPSDLPHGAKGLGESPTIGVPAAMARAVERVSGKRIRETPIRAEAILGREVD